MQSYQQIKDLGRKIILAGGLASMLGGCSGPPSITQHKDLTGDGVTDIVVTETFGFNREENWLFVGQKDGSFIRATGFSGSEDVKYFKTDEGTVYIWDGEFYRKIPQQD